MKKNHNLKTGSLIPVDVFRKMGASKGTKYNNTRITKSTIWGEVTFDSIGEYNCYLSLLPEYEMGKYAMRRQVKYPIEVNGVKITTYVADFVLDYDDGSTRVIDFKGVETDSFKLKKKLMEAVHGIKIELIKD
jgi:hypothetical protein